MVDGRDGVDHNPFSCIRLLADLLQAGRSRCLSHQRASTSDADEMADYIERALDPIPREGIPVWIFPTPRTDFAMTRSDLMRLLEIARALTLEGKGSSIYQQGVDQIKRQFGENQRSGNGGCRFLFWESSSTTAHRIVVSSFRSFGSLLHDGTWCERKR